MRKFLLIVTLFILSISILSAQQPLEEINKWAAQQTEEVNADDVINFLNVNGARAEGDITFGGEYVFNSGITYFNSSTTLDPNHFIVAYMDHSNSDFGTVIIGTINGNQVTYGPEFVFSSAAANEISIASLDETHFILAYRDHNNYNYGTAVIGTVAGNNISFSSNFVFSTSGTWNCSAVSLSATLFVISYRVDAWPAGYSAAIAGSISGNSITFGDEQAFNFSTTAYSSIIKMDESKFIIAYLDYESYVGTAISGLVSGNSISFGSKYIFNANYTAYISATSLDNTHFIIAYDDVGTPNGFGTAILGTLNGSDISFGAEYGFSYGETSYISSTRMDNTHFVIAYQDVANAYYGNSIIGTVSDNTILFGSEYVFNYAFSQYISVSSMDESKFTIAFQDFDNSSFGTAIVGEIENNTSSEMTLEFNTNLSEGTTITLPLYGTVDVAVDWGDGNSETFTTTGDKNHIYSTEGTKTVSINGTLTQFGSGWSYSNAEKLVKVTSFGNLGLTSLNGAFYGTTNLEEVPTILPLSVSNLSSAFFSTGKAIIIGLSSWDVGNVTNMNSMFNRASNFNQSLNSWDVSSVTNMEGMFQEATTFNQPLNNWNVSSVIYMSVMFSRAFAFNQDISNWSTSNVTRMSSMFEYAIAFNHNINSWDVSSATEMNYMFDGASAYNQPLNNWNTSSVTSMYGMFRNTSAFNQEIGNWDVSSVTDMNYMFVNADAFNKDLSSWDVSSVNNMSYMFSGADVFNQDINGWNVSNVSNMEEMFRNTNSFNQNISSWNISNVSNMTNMFDGIALSTPNYNSLLIAWASLDLYNGVNFSGGNSRYSAGAAATARAAIISDDLWTITDGGEEDITTMELEYNLDLSSGTTITLPLYGTVDVTVDWGDNNAEVFTTNGDKNHTYATGGTKIVNISGTLTQFGSGTTYDNADKLIKVNRFGETGLNSLKGAFFGTTNLVEVSSSLPVTINDLSYSFHLTSASSIIGLSNWNLSNVTNMKSMFGFATNFNQDLSNWDVSSVVNMGEMFISASSFNQPLDNWNVENVTHMHGMFRWASSFDQNLKNWNISNVQFMDAMFSGSTLSTINYNDMLIAWAALDLYNGVIFSGGNSKYSPGAAAAARAAIIADDGWTITDGGMEVSVLWDGSSDNEWAISSNWVGGVRPTLTDNVVIPVSAHNPVIIPGSAGSCNSLIIDNGASLTLHSDGTSGTASLLTNGTITNNGTINVERYITDGKWHLISSPISDATANIFSGEYLQYYNGSWNDITVGSTSLTSVKGYSLWDVTKSSTYTFTGNLNSGDQSIGISSANDGWNLLGNPYPSPIDWSLLDDTYGAVYYWDSENSNYVSWNNGSGAGVQYVPAMQGFWINTPSDGTFSLNNTHRTHNGTTTYYKNREVPSNYIELQVNGSEYYDQLFIRINEQATNDFDFYYDAYKLMSSETAVPQLYSYAGDEILSIDNRPECQLIQLGFQCSESGNYSINLNQITDITSVILEDTKTGMLHNMQNGSYEFEHLTSDDDQRFILHLQVTGIYELPEKYWNAYTMDKTICIESEIALSGKVGLCDLMGRTLLEQQVNNTNKIKIPTHFNTGLYIVRFENGSDISSKKVIIY